MLARKVTHSDLCDVALSHAGLGFTVVAKSPSSENRMIKANGSPSPGHLQGLAAFPAPVIS